MEWRNLNMILFKKSYSDFTDEYDKDDIYSLEINDDINYQGEYKIVNLSIWYALTIFCDIIGSRLVLCNAYMQNAEDDEYRMRLIDANRIPELAEDLEDFLECIRKKVETLN